MLPPSRLCAMAAGLRRSFRLVSHGPALRRSRPERAAARSGRARISTSRAGEILHVDEEPESGERTFEIDNKTGEIVDEANKAFRPLSSSSARATRPVSLR